MTVNANVNLSAFEGWEDEVCNHRTNFASLRSFPSNKRCFKIKSASGGAALFSSEVFGAAAHR